MSLDLSLGIDNTLILVKENKDSLKVMRLTPQEVNNLFFYLVKRKVNLFSEIKDDELKSKIIEFLMKKEEQ